MEVFQVSSLGILSDLRQLALFNNNLQGKVPTELFSLEKLSYLNLAKNNLSGRISLKFGDLMEKLVFDDNNFTGRLVLRDLRNTKISLLSLSFNRISMELDKDVGLLRGLKYLYLDANEITGKIPTTIGLLTKL